MIVRLLRQIRIVLKFMAPDAETRAYVRLIRQSGQFDRDFYFVSNPRLRRLFRLAPERHYALFGEPAGLCPNPRFSPRAYVFNNPDLTPEDTARPLRHYIETGQAQSRVVLCERPAEDLALPEIDVALSRPARPAPFAVVLHLYYHEMWPEFASVLRRQVFDFDLYVTATGSEMEVAPLRDDVLCDFPRAQIWAMPNHGRDIFPFLHLLDSGLLAPYRAVCKLHTKKSPHRGDGDEWRRRLIAGILGEPAITLERLRAFLADSRAGVWVADGQHYRGEEWWGCNRALTGQILARAGIDVADRPLTFPAGSIYWLKPAILARLAALGLKAADFDVEQALVDGTTAHAVERVLGYLIADAGLEIRQSGELRIQR